jgi:hypothetical protein
VKEAIKAYSQNPDVLYAEPDYVVHATITPNDPRFSELWGLHNTGETGGTPDADIDAPEAWDITTGSATNVVAVIDSGIDYNHADLAANTWSSPTGFTVSLGGTDLTCPAGTHGVNAIDPLHATCDPMDDSTPGHGTHVAGTIGAVGNNNVGVIGVNWSVQLMACKFLDAGGYGTASGAVACLDFVKAMKDAGVNIIASNNSWGGGSFSQSLQDAIQAQQDKGILFIAAAANTTNNNDVSPDYPSSFYLPGVISVANTDRNDGLNSSSNFGKHTVHLGAPGTAILSTLPGDNYGVKNGTSMATPHVTGVAALLKAQSAGRDWKAIKNLILAGGDNTSALATKTVTGKRLNAYGSLTCSNSVVLSRLRPKQDLVATSMGGPIDLAALHINCDAPNGTVQVSVDPGGGTLTLADDGADSDQVAGDGTYSGRWTPSSTGAFTLGFPGSDNVTAQVLSGYSFASTDPNYLSITGTNLNLDDDNLAPGATVTSPFPLRFGGGSFNSLYVSNNGTITFVENFQDPTNSAIPTSLTSTLVAPFWDDLLPIPGTDQNVFWDVLGTAPNRELVIEWRDVHIFDTDALCRADTSAVVTFQIVFPEGSSRIIFNYADTMFGGDCTSHDQGRTATVGVQVGSQSGTQFSYMTASLADNSSILWTRPPSVGLSTTSLAFGDQWVGTTSAARNVILSNTGDDDLHFTAEPAVTGDFALAGNDCGSKLAGGNSCTFEVTFTPPTTGSKTGTLTIYDDTPGSPHIISLTGTGTSLIPTTTTISAPPVTYNSNASVTVTVTSAFGTVTGNVSLSVDGGIPILQALTGGSTTFTLTSPSAADHSLSASYAAQGNFAASSALGTLHVNPAPLTITANNASRTYGAANPTFTGTIEGIQNADNITATYATSATVTSPVGTYPIVPTLVDPTGKLGNYTVSSNNGTLTVTKATPTFSNLSSSQIINYGTASITLSGRIAAGSVIPPAGESVTITINGAAQTASIDSAGPFTVSFDTHAIPVSPTAYTITYSYAGDTNFNAASDNSTTLTVRGPLVSLSATTLTFDDRLLGTTSAPQTVTLTNTGTATLAIGGVNLGGANAGDFAKASDTCSGANIAPNASCNVGVTFTPNAQGARTGEVTISDDAPGSPHTVGLSGTGMDFELGMALGSSSSVTVTAGGTASYTVEVRPLGGFNQSVSLSCSGAPSASTCSLTPSSVTPDGTNPAQVAVRVTTTARGAGLPRNGWPWMPPTFGNPLILLWFMFLFGLMLMGRLAASVRRRRWWCLATALLLVLMWSACGGGGSPPPRPPGTPTGTWTLTVTATSSSLSHSTSLTLTVN